MTIIRDIITCLLISVFNLHTEMVMVGNRLCYERTIFASINLFQDIPDMGFSPELHGPYMLANCPAFVSAL